MHGKSLWTACQYGDLQKACHLASADVLRCTCSDLYKSALEQMIIRQSQSATMTSVHDRSQRIIC